MGIDRTEIEELKYFLDRNEVSQQDLSETIGTSRVALNQVLNSKRGLTPLMALKLEAALGVPAREILMKQLVVDLAKTHREHANLLEAIRARSKFRDIGGKITQGQEDAPATGTG